MKKYFLIFITFLVVSCENSTETTKPCNSNNPLQEITWLKDLKIGFEQSASAQKKQIIQYTYKGKNVFMIDSCFGCADNLITVYDCDKNVICEFGGIAGVNTCPDFEKEATNKIILWEN